MSKLSDYIYDELQARGWDCKDIANNDPSLHVKIVDIVYFEKPMSDQIATIFGNKFGISPNFFIDLRDQG